MLSDLRYRLRALFRRRVAEHELDEELRFHFDQQVEKFLQGGLPHSEAVRKARLFFGGIEQVKEECRQARGLEMIETLFQDVRQALRIWRKSPGFTLAAIAAIAVGIGVNTAVFTLANAVLFKSLAYESAGRVVYIQGTEPGCEFPCDSGRSYPDFRDFKAQAKSFRALIAYRFDRVNLGDAQGSPERYAAMTMSANAFAALKQKPVLGRDFTAEDERAGAPPVALLTHQLWENRYGKDPSIVGKTIRIDEVPTIVIGVMPARMQFRASVDLWLPLVPTGDWLKRDHRRAMLLGVLARGVSLGSARAELETISRRLAGAYPEADSKIGVRMLEGSQFLNPRIRLVFTALWVAVGLVLLVACANVANLLLARAVVRRREISIRVALGAGRWRVVRQLLAESVTLSAAGGMLGLFLARWGVSAFDRTVSGTGKPAWLDFSMDATVLAYLCAAAAGSGILFGLAPALRLSRMDVSGGLKDGGSGAGGGWRTRYLSGVLVAGEMAFTVVLLTATVVSVRALLSIYRSDIGLNPGNILTMRVDLPERKYPLERDRISFFDRLLARLSVVPGVGTAALASTLPGHGPMSMKFEMEGTPPAGEPPETHALLISPDYFRALGLHPVTGREFTASDGVAGVPAVIVNRSFAAAQWPGESPVGRRLRLVEDGTPRSWLTVIGVAPDVWQNDMVQRQFEPLIYLPYRAMPGQSMYVVAHTDVPPATLAQTFGRAVRSLDPGLPVYGLQTMVEELQQHDWPVRVFGSMFAIFTAIAMLLAMVGLYAVVAHSVNQRIPEIGVRMALGAPARSLMASVFAAGMRPVVLGLSVGLVLTIALARVSRALLSSMFQPGAGPFVIVALVLLVTALLACGIPARRATRVDPMTALRYD